MITKEHIEAQRKLFSQAICIGENFAIKVLNVRNRHFGILDGITVPDRIMVDIDPQYVFGDGTHATTQMVTEEMERHTTQGARVLDIGCGTGIQSIISLLLGAGQAESVDIDLSAVKATEYNAILNNVGDRLTARVANLTEGASGTYDLVVANILADPIIELVDALPDFVHENTIVILSGVKEDRDADVTRAIRKNFTISEKEIRDGWVCYVVIPGASDNGDYEISDAEALDIILGGDV